MTLISDHPEQDYTRWQGDTCFITSAQSIQVLGWQLGVVLCDVRLRPEQKYESVLNISHTSHRTPVPV